MERFTKSTLNHWFDNLQRENYLNLQDDVEDDMNFTISPGRAQPEESWIDLEDRSREEQSRFLHKLGNTIEEEYEEGWLFNQSGKGNGNGSGSDKPNVNFKEKTVNQERNGSGDKQVPYQEFQPDITTSLTTILGKPPRTSTVSPFTVYSSQYSSSQIPRVTFMNIESSTQSLSSSSDLSPSIEKRKTIDKPMGINMVNLTLILVVNAVGFFLFGFLCGVGFKRQLHSNIL